MSSLTEDCRALLFDEIQAKDDRIVELEERNSYLKSWGHNQYGNLKERIKVLEEQHEYTGSKACLDRNKVLEAEKIELAKGNIKRWEDSCTMADRIKVLEDACIEQTELAPERTVPAIWEAIAAAKKLSGDRTGSGGR